MRELRRRWEIRPCAGKDEEGEMSRLAGYGILWMIAIAAIIAGWAWIKRRERGEG